ncbi:MAG: 16S rRNA (adenine(1518)-N(6)/adenine(1519)-N(6))-dimethyltransferase RsmA [Candidatus Bostrichicola ureolyticus]|nr:MAG: 16S rRNA (adenine(1518)-N(6)/adenine(1519)-N(6))-dimethyltransferase RsmA [Candidatus Bostrichicola ureolyticus]
MLRTKKYLGQHILKDKNIANKIVNSLSFIGYNTVVEVGAGTGALSNYLLKRCNDLYLIEIDNEYIFYLKKNFPNLKNRIIHDNFLKWNPKNLNNFAIIGNFPYNISSQILFHILKYRQYIPECIGMFQKQVAERIATKHGNKIYGLISVLVQTFYNVEYLFTVTKNVFIPKPKVESVVIRLIRKTKYLNCNEELFFKLVKTAFNQRRKKLFNALKPLYLKPINKNILKILEKRAEELSYAEFIDLTIKMDKMIL